MKTPRLVVVLSGLLIIMFMGCEKFGKSDNIIFTDLNPDTSITSIRTWVPTWDGLLPVPSDSMASLILDLDNDEISDIKVSISTVCNFESASNPHANFFYGSAIGSIENTDAVAYSEDIGVCILAQPFLSGQEINKDFSYHHVATTYATGTMTIPCHGNTFNGDTYYGIRIKKGKKYCYGWILISLDKSSNSLTIKEYAINTTVNRPIIAGQKE